MSFVRSQFHLFWLLVLVLALAFFFGFRSFGWRVEDLQTALFPIVLVSVWQLPRDPRFTLPVPVLGGLFFVWGGAALNVRGLLPDMLSHHGVYLSRLDDDPSGLLTSQFLWNYNRIADQRRQPEMGMVERGISTDESAEAWLDSRTNGMLLLRGSTDWMRMVFPPGKRMLHFEESQDSAEVVQLAKDYGLYDGDEVAVVKIGGVSTPLLMVATPESAALPTNPVDTTVEYLGWLAEAFQSVGSVTDLSDVRGALQNASDVGGLWKTSEPRAASQLLVANLDLLAFVSSDGETAIRKCAQENFWRTRSIVQPRYAPQIAAAVENNLALMSLSEARSREDLRNVKELLTAALNRETDRGMPVRGAQAALVNTILLQRAGVF